MDRPWTQQLTKGMRQKGRVVWLLVIESLATTMAQSALTQAGRMHAAHRPPLQLLAFLNSPPARAVPIPPATGRVRTGSGPAALRASFPRQALRASDERPLSARRLMQRWLSLGMSESEPGAGAGKKKKAKKRRVDELLVEQGLADDAKVGLGFKKFTV